MATILLTVITALSGRDGLSASTLTLYTSNYGRGRVGGYSVNVLKSKPSPDKLAHT